jgi:hypothetical protein
MEKDDNWPFIQSFSIYGKHNNVIHFSMIFVYIFRRVSNGHAFTINRNETLYPLPSTYRTYQLGTDYYASLLTSQNRLKRSK